MKLFLNAVGKFMAGVVITGLLLFLPAGTVQWLEGWIFMAVLFVPMLIAGMIMFVKNPDLLRSRLDAKEKQNKQKTVVLFSGLMFAAGFLLAGFNYRFSWLLLPHWISRAAVPVFLIAYGLLGEVFRENVYLSRTVQVQKDQKIVDSGLYGIVRHPMYAVTLLLFLSMPLMLGSLWSFFVFLLYPFLIGRRIGNEEQVLREQLPGYLEYCEKVRCRLIPGIW